jgi:translation initiation factor 2B subunit (eIF-2B alpha/beta/delta family)
MNLVSPIRSFFNLIGKKGSAESDHVPASIGDASSLLSKEKDRISTHLTPIHLLYDLTPASLVTAVCTEVGFIPPSSVPTVISKPGEAAGF